MSDILKDGVISPIGIAGALPYDHLPFFNLLSDVSGTAPKPNPALLEAVRKISHPPRPGPHDWPGYTGMISLALLLDPRRVAPHPYSKSELMWRTDAEGEEIYLTACSLEKFSRAVFYVEKKHWDRPLKSLVDAKRVRSKSESTVGGAS